MRHPADPARLDLWQPRPFARPAHAWHDLAPPILLPENAMNILLAIDGSDASDRAARYVVQLSKQLAEPPALTMVNVSEPLLPTAARKLGRKATSEYYASNNEYAVRKARRTLERAHLAFDEAFLIGDA